MFLLSHVHWPVLVIWVSCTEETTETELSGATLIRRERPGGEQRGQREEKGGKRGQRNKAVPSEAQAEAFF